MISVKPLKAMVVSMALLLLLGACSTVPKVESFSALDQSKSGPLPALDQLLADPIMQGSLVSLTVRDADTGATLYQRNGQTRLLPASSLKLMTTAAAMGVLGPDYRFTTRVLTNGTLKDGRLEGNLYVRGSGDPSIQAQDYQQIAADLAAQGIRRISGDLLMDDTAFDGIRLGADWANDDESASYAAQISALTLAPDSDFDAGTVIVAVRAPATEGAPLDVSVSPANTLLTVSNQAVVGATNTLSVKREHGNNHLVVTGTLPTGTNSRKWVSVWEPTRLVADVFHQALLAQGIKVGGQTLISVATPPGSRVLVSHDSLPLAQLLTPLLKLSNNGMTEVLLKAMGRRTDAAGTAEAGIAAVSGFFERQGIESSTIIQVDGSGLSRRNLISTQHLTDVLLSVRSQDWFERWYGALPIAGNPERMVGGTLRNRLRGTFAANNLHAKTGSMTGVSSLSGYLRSAKGQPLVFAMIANNYLADGAEVRRLEDQVVLALTQWGD